MRTDTFGGEEIVLPEKIPGWDVDDSGQRYDFEYDRRAYPLAGNIVSNLTDFGLYDIFSNDCGNFHENYDGKDGRPEIKRFTVSLHCLELLYIAEVIRFGNEPGSGYCYKVLAAYQRST
jgi:hypothetical protein